MENTIRFKFIRALDKKEIVEKYDYESNIRDNSYYSQDSLMFVAKALVDELVPSETLEKYSWSFKNKELRWRHELPEKDIDMLIGHIWDSWTEDGELYLRAEIWGYPLRPELKEIQQKVIDGELSISAGFKNTKNEDGETFAIYGRELSLTPTPACTPEMGCGITEVFTTNEKKVTTMVNEDNKLYDMLTAQIKENRETIQKFESGVLAHNKLLKETNIELEKNVEVLSDRVKDLNKKLVETNTKYEETNKKLESLEKENESLKTLPLRETLVDLEKIKEEKAKEERLEFLKQYSSADLQDRIDGIKRAVNITEKVNNSNSKRPELVDELENNSNQDNETPEQFALRMNPKLNTKYGSKQNA